MTYIEGETCLRKHIIPAQHKQVPTDAKQFVEEEDLLKFLLKTTKKNYE
jgi:hypothetical protein